MSIDAGAQVAIILLACGPCVVIVNLLGQVCTLGRAPCTKETLPDFHEWCWVTRHPRIFHGLTDCQRIPRVWGVTTTVKVRINAIHTEGSHEETKPIDGPKSFPPVNPNMIIVPHYDALVITLCINGFDVHRVLEDPSSVEDLLQLSAFKQVKISLGMLNSAERILFSFNRATTVN